MSGETWASIVDLAALCAVPALLLAVYQLWLNRSDRIKDHLADKGRRDQYADRLRRRALSAESYRRSLEARSAGWDRFFGERLIGWKSFSRCLFIAFVYPFLLFASAYVLGGDHSIGGLPIFADADWWPERALRAGAVITIPTALLLCLRFVEDEENGFLPWLRKRLPAVSRWTEGRSAAVLLFTTWITASALAIAAVLAIAGAGAGAGAGAVGVAGAGAGAGAVGVRVGIGVGRPVGVGVVFSLLVFSFIGRLLGDFASIAAATFIFLFFLLLPILNAMVDVLSWGITRWFVRQAARLGLTGRVFLEALVDIVLAFVCLMLLAALLPNAIALSNPVLPGPGVDWAGRAAEAVRDPFGAGFMVTGMLLTTMIPTAIHLWDGLRGILVAPFKGHPEIADKLEA
ncbi:MAG: hypothetical protein AAGF44_12395, partial [Pseudomonadota bacterium]